METQRRPEVTNGIRNIQIKVVFGGVIGGPVAWRTNTFGGERSSTTPRKLSHFQVTDDWWTSTTMMKWLNLMIIDDEVDAIANCYNIVAF